MSKFQLDEFGILNITSDKGEKFYVVKDGESFVVETLNSSTNETMYYETLNGPRGRVEFCNKFPDIKIELVGVLLNMK